MRRAPLVGLLALAAACWIAAGPGGMTVQALLACRHDATHQSHQGHGGAPANAPCFCGEMTGGSDVAVSAAVPTPPMPGLTLVVPVRQLPPASLFPLPPSPSFGPTPPPPNRLG